MVKGDEPKKTFEAGVEEEEGSDGPPLKLNRGETVRTL